MFSHVHTTRDDKQMLVAQMKTSHLLNTIRFNLRKLERIVNMAKVSNDKFSARLYGVRILTPEDAAQAVNRWAEFVSPYLMEVLVRIEEIVQDEGAMGLIAECSQLLQKVIGRNEALTLDIDLPLLGTGRDPYTVNDYDDGFPGEDGDPSNYGDN